LKRENEEHLLSLEPVAGSKAFCWTGCSTGAPAGCVVCAPRGATSTWLNLERWSPTTVPNGSPAFLNCIAFRHARIPCLSFCTYWSWTTHKSKWLKTPWWR
jgi:hypothetical protein